MLESTVASPSADLQSGLRRNFPELEVEPEAVQRQEIDGLEIAIARASITRHPRSDEGSSSVSDHTIAYHQSADAVFPQFVLQPVDFGSRVVAAFGLQGLRFADQPEFSKQYFVLSGAPLRAQALLERDVRDWLLAHPGMSLEAGGNGVLAYRSGPPLEAADREVFAHEAAELVDLLVHAQRMAARSPRQPGELDEARAFAAQLPGFAGAALERQFLQRHVTRADLDAFLRQEVPRRIPRNIAYSHESPKLLAGLGLFFALGGAVFFYAGVVSGHSVAVALATLFLAVGGTMAFIGMSKWRRARRLLRHGQPALATILGIEPTGVSINERQLYAVRLKCVTGGQARQVECRAWREPAERLAAAGRPVRILYDPDHPERVVLVDALVNSGEI